MLDMLGAIVVGVAPVWALIALLLLADVRCRRRREVVERQIALTDAIHRELGAVVAPVVRRWGRGAWRVFIAVPLERPRVVERVLEIVHRTLQPFRYAIVLTPQPEAIAPSGPDTGRRPRPVERPVAPGPANRDRVPSRAAA